MYSNEPYCTNINFITFSLYVHVHVGPLRSSHLWQPVRRLSTLPSSKWVELRMASGGGGGRGSILQLEERANDEYDNPQAQVKYMEVSLYHYSTVEPR